tara:strand:- start:76 stop:438 length:363 start_codon:yes stop_codon:yes gene_type:complete
MTNSTQSLLNTIDQLKASGVTPTVKVLKTRGPRKGETLQRDSQHGRGMALGGVKGGDRQMASNSVGGGKGGTITKVCGIGKDMVSNLSKVQSDYERQVKADRKAAAQDRLMDKIDEALAL